MVWELRREGKTITLPNQERELTYNCFTNIYISTTSGNIQKKMIHATRLGHSNFQNPQNEIQTHIFHFFTFPGNQTNCKLKQKIT